MKSGRALLIIRIFTALSTFINYGGEATLFRIRAMSSQFPLSGPPMRDTELRRLGYHFVVVDKYIVIYRLIQTTVVVYHIFDGRSDYPTLFRAEVFKQF